MQIRKLNEEIGIAGQIRPQDMPEIKAMGYRTVLCNRPDGEADDQPLFEDIATAAGNCDLHAEMLPVLSSGLTSEDVDALKAMWQDLPKPVLAYCRSGARSTALLQAALDLPAQG